MTDPKGNPGCFRDSVDRLPVRPKYISVRARSANAGSGSVGRSLGPGPACFLTTEVIEFSWEVECPCVALYSSRNGGSMVWSVHNPAGNRPPRFSNRRIQLRRQHSESGGVATPSQLVYVVEKGNVSA